MSISSFRTLGRNGPQVNSVGFGAMSLGGAYGAPASEEESLSLLDHAYSIGQRFWDTADVYGESEALIGKWLQKTGKRHDIFLATKGALHYSPEMVETVRSDPEYLKSACEKSLKRLGVETIDLYYSHRVDGVTPIERTIDAMVELKNQGKIRYIGLSEVSAATLRRAHAVHPITAMQIEYSPFSLDIESPKTDILRTCRELGIAVVAYSPIGRGVLTGKFRSLSDLPEQDVRRVFPKFSEENFPKIVELVLKLEEVAEAHNSTPSQIAIAWLLAQGPDIIPIPGTKSVKYLVENAGAADIILTEGELKKLREKIDQTELDGNRYPDMLSRAIIADTPLP
ncbi:Aldo/keto reductase [Aspergillus heteromorphus CBS 117.55]|uniref:Aldo/keto reductase n=1 Tax=Aspergillus heteromorphus CBS 117.55 TaxID=1448321 RepID=A0A317W6E0_9EURO|nr:Aldo/keto reductase [Aspergillus heteromorphus CBS 117.55]PWY79710.1 Aldo/keto reductase [Aspergillus heteromorphus CBS 117.55]